MCIRKQANCNCIDPELTCSTNGLPSEQLFVKKRELADVEQHLDIYNTKRINYIINLEI